MLKLNPSFSVSLPLFKTITTIIYITAKRRKTQQEIEE
jgi:hypothetical protein